MISKKVFALLLTIFLMTALMGCGNGPSISNLKNVKKIELLKIEGFDLSSATVLKTFTDEETIEKILSAIKNSQQLQGILDIRAPDYALRIFHKQGGRQTFYLWTDEFNLGRYSGIIVDVVNSGIGYTLKEDAAKYLHHLIYD